MVLPARKNHYKKREKLSCSVYSPERNPPDGGLLIIELVLAPTVRALFGCVNNRTARTRDPFPDVPGSFASLAERRF